jgi:hypothetical protein
MDKMAFDMAVDFKDAGVEVAAVSLWMGSLTSERLLQPMKEAPDKFKHLEEHSSPPDILGTSCGPSSTTRSSWTTVERRWSALK